MSSWDETGFHISDPKHPDNASAGAGAPGLWRAKRADPVVYVCENPEKPARRETGEERWTI